MTDDKKNLLTSYTLSQLKLANVCLSAAVTILVQNICWFCCQ